MRISSILKVGASSALTLLGALGMTGCTLALPMVEADRRFAAEVERVIDGDTIEVVSPSGRNRTVRLLGIDTPETKRPGTLVECAGLQATDSMVRLAFASGADEDGDGLLDHGVGTGHRVRLRTDPSQARRDRYGRLLAYAKVRGGPQLNLAQVRRGWAETYVFAGKPFALLDRFRSAQHRAAESGRGAWSLCGGRFHAPAR